MEIGYSYRDDGDFDAARETFERAAAILPDEASDAYIEVAWSILDVEGDLEEARDFAERAVETNPENPYAWDVLAAAWEALEDIPQAATAYARLLELMPPDECPDCIAAAREVLAEAQRSSAETVRSTRIATVSVPGSWNDVVGCDGTWLPECPAIRLEPVGEGIWAGAFALPAGEWEVKVAINGTWEINFGRLGLQDGLNIPFVLERDAEVTFTFRAANRLLEIDIAR
jgi:tetratricopeptide (TPR) repeat protein